MSKRRYNVGRSRDRVDGKAIAISVLALLLAGVLTVSIGLGTAVNGKWFANANFKTWFGSWGHGVPTATVPDTSGKPDTPDTPAEPTAPTLTGDSGFIVENSAENGISLTSVEVPADKYAEYGISPLAEKSYELTVTVYPAEATDKSINWAVAFETPDSGWANGKNVSDYVTVTPTSDGSNVARISCLQAFGAKVILTVSSRSDPDKTATCAVDYMAQVVEFKPSLINRSINHFIYLTDMSIPYLKFNTGDYEFDAGIELSVGTLTPTYSCSLYIMGTQPLEDYVYARGAVLGSRPTVNTTKSILTRIVSGESGSFNCSTGWLYDTVVYLDEDWYEDDYSQACRTVTSYLRYYDADEGYPLRILVELNSSDFNIPNVDIECGMDFSAVSVSVSNVELDKDNIVF